MGRRLPFLLDLALARDFGLPDARELFSLRRVRGDRPYDRVCRNESLASVTRPVDAARSGAPSSTELLRARCPRSRFI